MQQFRIQDQDGNVLYVTEDEMRARAEAFHAAWRSRVANHVKKMVRAAGRGSRLIVGGPDWQEFVYGPNAVLASAMDHNTYLRSQTPERIKEIFDNQRLFDTYGTPLNG